jgi:hypothetical protein
VLLKLMLIYEKGGARLFLSNNQRVGEGHG